jgi:hypothetical protein
MKTNLILVGTPSNLNVPLFSMPVPMSREDGLTFFPLENLAKHVGQRCAKWVASQHERCSIELLQTRNFMPINTAFYCDWLSFGDEAVAQHFVEMFPQLCLERRLAKLSLDTEDLSEKLKRRLKRGDFDLGRVGDERQRENLAARFLDMTKSLSQLHAQKKLLEKARELSVGWQTRLAESAPP